MNALKLTVFFLLVASGCLRGQPFGCIDSTRLNPYFTCRECYKPVCGCDGVTYRSECAALNWGGVTSFIGGVCGNFDLDFVPNPIDPLYGGSFCDFYSYIFVNPDILPVNAEIYLYDIFYATPYFFRMVSLTSNDSYGTGKGTPISELDNSFFANLKEGVYVLIVTINGEKRTKKLVLVNTR